MKYIKSISLCGCLLSALLVMAPITGQAQLLKPDHIPAPEFCTKPVHKWNLHDVLMAPLRGFMILFNRSCDNHI